MAVASRKRVCPVCKVVLVNTEEKMHCLSNTCTWVRHKCGAVFDWRTNKHIT